MNVVDDPKFGPIGIDDEMFDIEAVADGAWVPSPYGAGDQLGTYNEVTSEKRAAALASLDLTAPVNSYSLGSIVFNGYPAFDDRSYRQQLVVAGYQPPADFEGITKSVEPFARNRVSYHEERIFTTYNLASKINGLLHVGMGDLFYNGFRGEEIARTWGAAKLDNLSWGAPLLTRGFLVDVVGLMERRGEDVFHTADGRPVLTDNYRISLEDIEAAIAAQGLPEFEPGDAIFVRSGWNNLARTDPERFLGGSAGPWLRETRWLASKRPALVATDSWVWGTLNQDVVRGNFSACHQELCMRFGLRFGEGICMEELADAGVDRFVLCHAPFRGEGATSASSPAMAIANPRQAGAQ